ncbi:MAG: hypothetical protein RBU25_13500, partial [Lentisphaeria bacterium]|nr:hypothetical protein [Lentisphaeria bacterium]
MRLPLTVLFWASALLAQPAVQFGFESGRLEPWALVEGTFGKLVCDRAEYHHSGGAYRKEGTWFLSTLESPEGRPDDRYTGVVVSPVVVLSGPEIHLLVGGGKQDETYVALCTLDGTEHRQARGENAQRMADRSWQVPELVGQAVYLKVVDRHTGGWGHVTLDDVRLQGMVDEAASARLLEQLADAAARRVWQESLDGIALEALAAGLRERQRQFPGQAADWQVFAAELDGLRERLAALRQSREPLAQLVPLAAELRAAGDALARRFLLAHPALRGRKILYVRRHQYAPDHHNTATLFQHGEING